MLQYHTVESGTLAILKELMAIPDLGDFCLVGGTALALYYGHRISVDLDLFSSKDFDCEELANMLAVKIPAFEYRSTKNPIGLFGYIGELKVDFVKYYHHPSLFDPQLIDGIRIYAVEDIAAMKIAAIMKRGVKKDFWDIAELLNHYTMEDLIDLYKRKFPNQQLLISIPYALTYFEDAEDGEDPISLKGQTWDSVKATIRQKVSDYLK